MDVSSAISCSVTTDHLFICHRSSVTVAVRMPSHRLLRVLSSNVTAGVKMLFHRRESDIWLTVPQMLSTFLKNEVHNIYYQPNIFVIYQISKLCGTSALGYSLWDQTWFTSIVFLISLVHEHFFISELELLLLLLKPSQITSLILSQL